MDLCPHEREGKQSFVALSHEEAAKIGNPLTRIMNPNGSTLGLWTVSLAINVVFLCAAHWLVKNDTPVIKEYIPPSRIPSALLAYEIFLIGNTLGLLTQKSFGVYKDLKGAAKHMLETGRRPIKEVSGLLPAIPQNQVITRIGAIPQGAPQT